MDIIVNTFGTYVTKDTNNFVIVHKDGKQMLDASKVKSISLSKGAQISTDAAILAIENGIDVFFVGNTGEPIGRIWSNKYGSVSTIRRNQLDFTFSEQAVEWIKNIVIDKIDNQVAIILSFMPDDDIRQEKIKTAIRKLNDYKIKIKSLNALVVSEIAPSLRGWEGAAAKIYFSVIALFVKPELFNGHRSQNPAFDIFNCLLNYGYGILYGKVEGSLIKAGIDPYVGVMHRDDYNRPVLVFDVIEKFRVWVDYVVINLCLQNAIDEDCVSIKQDGSIWLEALGKRILIQSLNDYMDEIIKVSGVERSRTSQIKLYAHKLAQEFIKYKG
ncbi:MAG: CRISPR-associated endonuclease Cas1 [Bacteroidales bacterium]|jgi:CRISPR-associated protein Cas1|nr:CRISPR-associated endonuclease Cas1 [Bacteroidales bacterium]MDD2387479.1 CRISPR-associated endonuclease Cas1 [Bacteroidales bacterium]MDD4218418.1 CRISPR-associated endonuclease Cas1 [Bacteroidales bacterium]MDY0143357.1 CRISPR-associated endonuclease Cas1 [Bacteroidales bacterium]